MRLIVSLACCCLLVVSVTSQTPPRPIANRTLNSSQQHLTTNNVSTPAAATEGSGRNGSGLDARHREGEPGGDGAAPVPEPSALFLVGSGLLGIAITARLRRRERPSTSPS